jgi:hypothetical protein
MFDDELVVEEAEVLEEDEALALVESVLSSFDDDVLDAFFDANKLNFSFLALFIMIGVSKAGANE